MSSARSRWRRGVAIWPAAVLVGLVLGVVGFVVAPLPVGNGGQQPSTSPGPSGSPTASSPAPASSSTKATPTAETPPFTRAALLQPDELRGFGWGKADQTAVYDGADKELPSLCVSPAKIGSGAEEAYAAEYQGLQTHAVEVVVRRSTNRAAQQQFDRLTQLIGGCESVAGHRTATPTRKYQPRLGGVSEARWWQLKIPADSAAPDRATRGTVAVARVDDRLVYLLLTSPSSDPASTVQFEPLLTQAARRMV